MPVTRVITLVVALAAWLGAAAFAHAQPLAELLRVMPQSGAPTDREVVEYLDLAQFALDGDEAWRSIALHPGEGRLHAALDVTPERYGFDLDDAQLLGYGEPPRRALLLRVAYQPERVREAVRARGFEAVAEQAVERYVSGDDCATDVAAGSDGDLLAGRLGRGIHLALLPGALASACRGDVVDDVLAAHAGAAPTLAATPGFDELVEATLEHGDPAQALILGPGTGAWLGGIDPAAVVAAGPERTPDEVRADLESQLEAERARAPLPLYTAALLADVGPGERVLLALHFADPAQAEAALPVVAARFEAALLEHVDGAPITIDASARAFERAGRHTAVVVASARVDAASRVFGSVVSALWRGDFAPLALP